MASPYAIPPTNPFLKTPGFLGEIWALGLRNPWRFSFDRSTGDLYIGDVGQGSFEEVDFQPAGGPGGDNYGWNVMEGAHCFLDPVCSQSGLTMPVVEYDHSQGCSVTGGFVYRGTAYPVMQGIYIYADFCSGQFWGVKRDGGSWQNALLLTETHLISGFGEDEAGNLYAADLGSGVVYEIVALNRPPSAPVLISPADGSIGMPSTIAFQWEPSADPDGNPVSYLFFLGTDPSFAGVTPVTVARTRNREYAGLSDGLMFVSLLSVVVMLAGILFLQKRRELAFAVVLAGILISIGCSGGGGRATATSVAPNPSHTETGLSPGTAYFWKVSADDGFDSTSSPVLSFTTGN